MRGFWMRSVAYSRDPMRSCERGRGFPLGSAWRRRCRASVPHPPERARDALGAVRGYPRTSLACHDFRGASRPPAQGGSFQRGLALASVRRSRAANCGYSLRHLCSHSRARQGVQGRAEGRVLRRAFGRSDGVRSGRSRGAVSRCKASRAFRRADAAPTPRSGVCGGSVSRPAPAPRMRRGEGIRSGSFPLTV